MREHLFRGKTIIADTPNDPGYWIEGFVVDIAGYHIVKKSVSSYYHEIALDETTEVWSETLGQFTGLYDKNGKRIFEGDIVKTKYGRLCTVVWFSSQVCSCWDLKTVGTVENCAYTKYPDPYDLWKSENLEVVGNIHDNPELLKGE